MSDKNLSGEEKRKRLKEQFKKDLKSKKEFLGSVNEMKKAQRLNNAVQGLFMEDDTDDWIQKVNEESAVMDAKAEIAMDDSLNSGYSIPIDDGTDTEAYEKSEAEMKKIIANDLVAKMKAEMAAEGKTLDTGDLLATAPPAAESKSLLDDDPISDSETEEEDDDFTAPSGRKTLGDF